MSFRSFIGAGPITPLITIGNRDPLCTKKNGNQCNQFQLGMGMGVPPIWGPWNFPWGLWYYQNTWNFSSLGVNFNLDSKLATQTTKIGLNSWLLKHLFQGRSLFAQRFPKKSACLLWDRTFWLHVSDMIAYKYCIHNHIVHKYTHKTMSVICV